MDRRGAAHLLVAGRPLAGAQPGQRPHPPRARHHAGLAGDRRADRLGRHRQDVRRVGRSRVLAGRHAGSPTRRRATTSRPTSTSVAVGADGKPGGPPTLLPYGGKEASFPVWTPDGRQPAADRRRPQQQRRRAPGAGRRRRSRPVPLAGLEHAGSLALARGGRPPRLPSSRHRRGHLARSICADPGRAADASRRRRLWEEGGDFSPDGARLAFSSNRSGAREILGRRRLRRSRAAAHDVRRAGARHGALVARSAAGRLRRQAGRQLGHLRRPGRRRCRSGS